MRKTITQLVSPEKLMTMTRDCDHIFFYEIVDKYTLKKSYYFVIFIFFVQVGGLTPKKLKLKMP